MVYEKRWTDANSTGLEAKLHAPRLELIEEDALHVKYLNEDN